MHYSPEYCHGDAWGSQTFAQLAHQQRQSTAYLLSDVPPSNGCLSDALKHRLAEEDLLDLEVLLRYRSIRTLRALESLETNERAVLLRKSRELYELLGIFPSKLKNTLNKLFGDVPQQGMFRGSPWAMQAGEMPYMHPQWAGGKGGWDLQQARPGGVPEPLKDPLEDDTHLKRRLGADLLGAMHIVGRERYTECLRRLKRSDELVAASCIEAAEALAVLRIMKEDVRGREAKEALKTALAAVRDVIMWRCAGNELGMDSREAMVRAFQEACRHTNCDENAVSQLTLSHKRIRDELAGGPPPKKRSAIGVERRTKGASARASRSSQAPAVPEEPKTVPAQFDPMAPSSSDAVLPHPDDPADLHEQGPATVTPSCGLREPAKICFSDEKPTTRRSLPPARRSPGARSRDAGDSVQMAQMAEMMKVMVSHLQEVKDQVVRLMQERDPFPFRQVIEFDDDDVED